MAEGISVRLPLVYNTKDGPFQLTKTIQEAVKQNFKNLILTNKGERLMDPEFGVGISSFLFENFTLATQHNIRSESVQQIIKYMPFVEIQDFIVAESKTNLNQFYIYIKYSISSLGALDELTFVVEK